MTGTHDVLDKYIGKVYSGADLPIAPEEWKKIGVVTQTFYLAYLQTGDIQTACEAVGFDKNKMAKANGPKWLNKLRRLIVKKEDTVIEHDSVSEPAEIRAKARTIRERALMEGDLNVALSANRQVGMLDSHFADVKKVSIGGNVTHTHDYLVEAMKRVEGRKKEKDVVDI